MLILVGVDGNGTKSTLTALARILVLESHEVLLVYVHDTGVRGGMERIRDRFHGGPLPAARADLLGVAEREASDSILAEAALLAAALGMRVHTEFEAGEPGRVLARLAAQRGADLIAIGARSGGDEQSPGPKSLGHTARFVVDHSPCPVLLLRHGAPPAP